MPLNLVLTIHLDAFQLARSGAVTITDLDGQCHAIETFSWEQEGDIPEICSRLIVHARDILQALPEQLSLLT